MDAATAGLIGTMIGALASAVGLYIQQRFQTRRERQRTAIDLALQEFNRDLELAKARRDGASVAPLASYVICNIGLLEAISREELTPEKVRELVETRDRILQAFPGAPTKME